MAFEYSDYFRKHKRIVFAVLTLIALFSFVIGDAISQRGGGQDMGRRARGWFDLVENPVAVVHGQRLDEDHLRDLAFRRGLLAQLARVIYREGEMRTLLEVGFSEREAQIVPDLQQMEAELQQQRQSIMTDPRYEQLRPLFTKFQELSATDRYKNLMEMKNTLVAGWLRSLGLRQDEFKKSFEPLSLIELLYWKQQADEMGIVMPNSVVQQDLAALGRNRLNEIDLQTLRVNLQRGGPVLPMDELLTALGDEFRAMIAREVVLGGENAAMFGMGAANKMAQLTPLDQWKAWVQLKTQLEVGILPVPVLSKEIVTKVKDPTPEELKAYFEKYKDKLASKSSPTPGFKQPKKYRFEMLHANIRAAQPARTYCEQWLQALDALDPLAAQLRLLAEYQARHKEFVITEVNEDFAVGTGPERTFVRLGSFSTLREEPRLVAQLALAGTAQAASLPLAPFAAGLVLQPGFRPVSQKEEQLLAAVQTLAHAAAGAFSWTNVATASPNRRTWTRERSRPFEEVASILALDLTDKRCREFLRMEMVDFTKKLADYEKKLSEARAKHRRTAGRNPAPFTPPLFDEAAKLSVDDFIRQFAAKRGLTYAAMKEARPQDALLDETGDDKPLTTYVIPALRKLLASLPEEMVKQNITSILTNPGQKLYGAFEVQDFTNPNWTETTYLWKVEQTDEKVPTFAEAESAVRTAWLKEQARPLAQAAAEELAQEAKKAPDGFKMLMDKPSFRPHEIIARYRLALNQASATSITYEPAPVPVIELPPADFVATALEKLKKPGDTWVVWNQPKDTAYLVWLRNREEPVASDAKAREEFDFKVMVPGIGRQPLVGNREFSRFVQGEKDQRTRDEWLRYLKSATQFDSARAEKLNESFHGFAKLGQS